MELELDVSGERVLKSMFAIKNITLSSQSNDIFSFCSDGLFFNTYKQKICPHLIHMHLILLSNYMRSLHDYSHNHAKRYWDKNCHEMNQYYQKYRMFCLKYIE